MEIILPKPSKIFTVFVARFDILVAYCWDTLWTTVIGLAKPAPLTSLRISSTDSRGAATMTLSTSRDASNFRIV